MNGVRPPPRGRGGHNEGNVDPALRRQNDDSEVVAASLLPARSASWSRLLRTSALASSRRRSGSFLCRGRSREQRKPLSARYADFEKPASSQEVTAAGVEYPCSINRLAISLAQMTTIGWLSPRISS
jgi:hypothetical protein